MEKKYISIVPLRDLYQQLMNTKAEEVDWNAKITFEECTFSSLE
jgi:hypothetical protein